MSIITALLAKSNSLTGQFFRYFLVGGVAFLADFALLFLLTEFGHIHYMLSASIAFMAGIAVNYALSVSWVFSHRSLDNKFHEFAIFSIIGILGLVFNEALIWFFTERVGFHYLGSKIVAATFILLYNFGARKVLLFSTVTGNEKSGLKQS
jgi:putative flippase GtrA